MLIINFNAYIDLFLSIFFFAFFVLFVYQTTRKNRYAPFFIASVLFGFIGSVFSFLFAIFPDNDVNIYQLLSATFLSLQFIFFFLFMEYTHSLKINSLRGSIMLLLFGFLLITSFGVVLLSKYPEYSAIKSVLLFLVLISYNLSGFYVYFIIGVPTYIKTYRYTKETRSLIMFIALIITGTGFLIAVAYEIFRLIGIIGIGGLHVLLAIGYLLPLIGLFSFLLCYITDINYLYRLPNDNYMLMVSYKSGVAIHTTKFETRYRQVDVDDNLLSAVITSINMVYKSVLDSEVELQNILSKEATIFMEYGEYVCVTMVSDNISAILDRSLKRYVKEFEKKFHELLEREDPLISDFNSAKELLKSIFPFLIVAK